MAALDLEEQEQLAQLKAWWQRFGNHVLTAVTLVFLAIAGYNGWNYYQRSQAAAAAQVYEGLQKLATAGDAKKVADAAVALSEQHPRSPFAAMGRLMAARAAFDANDLASAAAQLQWVIGNARDDEYKHVARVRLAGVQLDLKQFDQALKTLEAPHPPHFEALYGDRRGDILFATGKTTEAREQWQKALAAAGSAGTLKAALEFKLEMTGAAPSPANS
ncbi:MAG: tetratricopeptide repeat protein [Burkholderiales bacterium]|nr:tetratricopeptide repeat protein [Burkholderiales bacterium]